MKIITAEERAAEVRGPKILIAGPPGVGKTSLLRGVAGPRTLFVDLEAGDLAVQDVAVDQVRARSWPECRDLAAYLGGPNHAMSEGKAYSQAHFDAVIAAHEGIEIAKYDLLFVDSITVAARLCLQWAQQQPEAFSERTGAPNLQGAYGLLAREMIAWITQLQHAKEKAVVFVGILEAITDEFKRTSWALQIDGQKAGRELPGIVDEVLGMALVQFDGESEPVRTLICNHGASGVYPGFLPKDRSGRLDTFEPPDLGALLAKLTARTVSQQAA
jgi:hypothetical protein